MDDPSAADLDMIKALLATMHGSGAGMYEDQDDDDDDYDDEEDEEEDDDLYEHNIHSMVNNYQGGGDPQQMADGQMPNMQTMNFIQGLLNMSNGAGFPSMDGGMPETMDPDMGQPMDNDRGFLPSGIQSLVPNMNNEMVGALAGAFAGGMGAFVNQQGHNSEYMEMFDDGEILSDDEEDDDEEDEDDLDEEEEERDHHGLQMPSGGMMAAGLLAGGAALSAYQNYQSHHQPGPPAIMPPPQQPMHHQPPPRMEYHHPNQPPNQVPTSHPVSNVTALTSMSGGTVSRADPFAALAAGVGGVALGAGLIRPIVNNLVGNSGGATAVVNQLDSPSLMPPPRSRPDPVSSLTNSFGSVNLSAQHPAIGPPSKKPEIRFSPLTKDGNDRQTTISEKLDDDKASLGSSSSSSVTSGCGKSDTESVGKKTPTPPNPERNGGSCASITDLASATESMRDSDDNHSEAHNVTGNLSDLDAEIAEKLQQYSVGPLPVIMEKPTYGWSSMLGLERAKEALLNLFQMKAFPPVFEGMEGSCKGVLLFGPSGSGKTALARALAKEANNSLFMGVSSFYIIKHLPIDAIKLVRCLFEQARMHRPTVILFDDIDALSYHHPSLRESAMAAKQEIYAQVRGMTAIPPDYGPDSDNRTMNESLIVLGTTNQPWLLEDKLRRLFAYNIHVRLPVQKARHDLFRMFLQNITNRITPAEFDSLVASTEGYSAAEINSIIRQASLRVPVDTTEKSDVPHMTYGHLKQAMSEFTCAFNEGLKQKYSNYIKEATHKQEDTGDGSQRDKKDKPKGVKKFSQRIAKSLAAAVLAVID